MKYFLSLCAWVFLTVAALAGVKLPDGDYTLNGRTAVIVADDGAYMEIGEQSYIWNDTLERYDAHPIGGSVEFEQVDDNTWSVVGGGTLTANEP